ncbi:MAG: bifunctional tetrahydrofolate synthase/dihydrofolate synthase [Pseudomonadota bacterium]
MMSTEFVKTAVPLSDWLERISACHPENIELGLTRVREVAEKMNILPKNIPVFTVAGTNGKGSTTAFIAECLIMTGLKVGTFTSPHIIRFNERIRVNGVEVNDGDLIAAFERINENRKSTQLTYFEFCTLAALDIFSELIKKQQLDAIVLEVGLGGRLDAVNIVEPSVALVTSVGLDHTEWLGDTKEVIALEKAGISRPSKPLILCQPDIPKTADAYAEEIGAKVWRCGEHYDFEVIQNADQKQMRFSLQQSSNLLKTCSLALDNRWVPSNLAGAMVALFLAFPKVDWVSFNFSAVVKALKIPGRFQKIQAEPSVWLDVAHNVQACQALNDRLQNYPTKGQRIAVVGMLRDKRIKDCLEVMHDCVDLWYFASLSGERALSADEIFSEYKVISDGFKRKTSAACFENVAEAYKSAIESLQQEDQLIVFGSFYTVAEVLNVLNHSQRDLSES